MMRYDITLYEGGWWNRSLMRMFIFAVVLSAMSLILFSSVLSSPPDLLARASRSRFWYACDTRAKYCSLVKEMDNHKITLTVVGLGDTDTSRLYKLYLRENKEKYL